MAWGAELLLQCPQGGSNPCVTPSVSPATMVAPGWHCHCAPHSCSLGLGSRIRTRVPILEKSRTSSSVPLVFLI